MSYKHMEGYCHFCVETVDIHYVWLGYGWMRLCPTCGGGVTPHAKARKHLPYDIVTPAGRRRSK